MRFVGYEKRRAGAAPVWSEAQQAQFYSEVEKLPDFEKDIVKSYLDGNRGNVIALSKSLSEAAVSRTLKAIIKKIRKFPTKKFLVFTQFISSSIHMLEKLFKQNR
jgi:DNA-directed RNA polymerase specialized sigma subunit